MSENDAADPAVNEARLGGNNQLSNRDFPDATGPTARHISTRQLSRKRNRDEATAEQSPRYRYGSGEDCDAGSVENERQKGGERPPRGRGNRVYRNEKGPGDSRPSYVPTERYTAPAPTNREQWQPELGRSSYPTSNLEQPGYLLTEPSLYYPYGNQYFAPYSTSGVLIGGPGYGGTGGRDRGERGRSRTKYIDLDIRELRRAGYEKVSISFRLTN